MSIELSHNTNSSTNRNHYKLPRIRLVSLRPYKGLSRRPRKTREFYVGRFHGNSLNFLRKFKVAEKLLFMVILKVGCYSNRLVRNSLTVTMVITMDTSQESDPCKLLIIFT